MPSREDIEKLTQMLGLVNVAIPIISQLGFSIYDGIKAARAGGDTTTTAEAQTALDEFERVTSATRADIKDWLASHPPE